MIAQGLTGFPQLTVFFHAAAGALALSIMAVPLVSAKGGKYHRLFGKVYVAAMGIIVLTTAILSPWRIFFDPAPTGDSRLFAFFLLFIAALTGSALWQGIAALKLKKRTQPDRRLVVTAPSYLFAALALLTLGIGLREWQPLFIFFGLGGLAASFKQLRYWYQAPNGKNHAIIAHIDGLAAACISTLTAFFVTAVPRLVPGMPVDSIWIWLAPGIVLGPLFSYWKRKY